MRIIFMGTPDFSVPTLKALHEAGHEIAAVYSQPPRRAGRGKKERPSPVHAAALEMGVEVRTPHSMRDPEAEAAFLALEADVAVVVAYGLILPTPILEGPELGCLNVHASLLPRWRGAAPIQRAILAGDKMTGITIMQMERGLDTGPMLATASVPVDRKTSGELHDELAEIGARLMVETLEQIASLQAQEQDSLNATYAAKIDKAEARIDWHKPAEQIEREIRAFAPFPGSWFELEGERIKILRADVIGLNGAPGTVLDDELTIACGHGAIRPVRIQPAGKSAMQTEDFLRGKKISAGAVLR
ncbi:methionyl-tRNA formyltransferase [Altererythrobacter atlanticus]|uniref:Methionyl-tRNA formyltransferase n=1 Tax=Croceibacterium atlanticum TaxID=1267766 RepID=A0A0F7KNG5_9SPHN|nr:methionyl-tRNA formyltransferase [Croceibacterium atlanticum]AKH42058.1 Methionyl-tRNA formyltransferase [Croceibacterium atlanticum]MBB5733374.1 methionyl-tRNA formyltransferase [Croceibacterium atlanticum]